MNFLYFSVDGLPIVEEFREAEKRMTSIPHPEVHKSWVQIDEYERIAAMFDRLPDYAKSIFLLKADQFIKSTKQKGTVHVAESEFIGRSDEERRSFRSDIKSSGLVLRKLHYLVALDHAWGNSHARNEAMYLIEDKPVPESLMTVELLSLRFSRIKEQKVRSLHFLWTSACHVAADKNSLRTFADIVNAITGKKVEEKAILPGLQCVRNYIEEKRPIVYYGI